MRFCPTCGERFEDGVGFCPSDGAPTQAMEAEQGDPLLGLVVDGRYRIERMIGEGGMGVVYQAVHTVLNKKLALKVLRGEMARDKDVVQRFQQEAQAATSIGHQNIIDISDFGNLPDGSVYFVMEHLDGEDLTGLLTRAGQVRIETAMHIVKQIASALHAAHQRGIVHRDLKPDNIFLIKRGDDPHFVKVLDFGIAKVGGGNSKLTKTGMVFGTPHYMSPEQAAGQAVDQRTDIYALGIIMYEMFTGKVPFDADTFMGILSKHMFEVPVPPSRMGTGEQLGPVEDIVMQALAKKPEERFQSMDQLIDALNALPQDGLISVPSSLQRELGLVSEAGQGTGLTQMKLAAGLGRSKLGELYRTQKPLVLAAGTLLASLVVLLGVLVSAKDEAPPSVTVAAQPPPAEPKPSAAPEPKFVPAPIPEDTPKPKKKARVEAPVALVTVSTDPPGAQILVEGVLVGNAPVSLPKPRDAQTVEIKRRGYRSTTIEISEKTPDALEVTLQQARRALRRRSQPRPAMQTRRARPSITSEVVDPWAQ